MKNYVQPGNTLTATASADLVSGSVQVVGSLVGVASTDAANGTDYELSLCGVFEVPKAAVAYSQGAKLYWDAAAKKATNVAAGNTFMGYAAKSALAGDATTQVLLSRPGE